MQSPFVVYYNPANYTPPATSKRMILNGATCYWDEARRRWMSPLGKPPPCIEALDAAALEAMSNKLREYFATHPDAVDKKPDAIRVAGRRQVKLAALRRLEGAGLYSGFARDTMPPER